MSKYGVISNIDLMDRNVLSLIYVLVLNFNLKKVDSLNSVDLNNFIFTNNFFITDNLSNRAKQLNGKELQKFAFDFIENEMNEFSSYETEYLRQRILDSEMIFNEINFINIMLSHCKDLNSSIGLAAA